MQLPSAELMAESDDAFPGEKANADVSQVGAVFTVTTRGSVSASYVIHNGLVVEETASSPTGRLHLPVTAFFFDFGRAPMIRVPPPSAVVSIQTANSHEGCPMADSSGSAGILGPGALSTLGS
jgi:hypothetical protein